MLLTFIPNPKQKIAAQKWIDNEAEEICFGGAKGGGKSFLGATLIFSDALTYPDTFYFVAREQLNDLRKHTIPTIYEVFQKWGINAVDYVKYNGQDNYFQCVNGSRVYLLECKKNPSDPLFERFGSMQMTRGWIEEGGEVDVLAKENLNASIGRKNNEKYGLKRKLLITCNPKKNYLKREYVTPYLKNTLPPNKCYIQSRVTDNIRYVGKAYADMLSNMKDPVMRARLFEGDWDYDEDDTTLFLSDKLNNLFTNTFVSEGQSYITADIARMGSDKSVIGLWSGYRLVHIKSYAKNTTDQVRAYIQKLAHDNSVPMDRVIVDEDGVGGGVKDELGCKGFVNNSRAIAGDNYANLKTQCYYKLAEIVNEDMVYIAINDLSVREAIIEDLESIQRDKIDKDGKLYIMPKEDIKVILGRSPDYGDMIMMRMYYELKRPAVLA